MLEAAAWRLGRFPEQEWHTAVLGCRTAGNNSLLLLPVEPWDGTRTHVQAARASASLSQLIFSTTI